MVRRYIWPLVGLVCAAHFFFLQIFLNADRAAAPSVRKRTQLSLKVIERLQPSVVNSEIAELPKLQPRSPSAEIKTPPTLPVLETPEPTLSPQQPVQSSGLNPTFDRSKFLDFDAVDQSAISTSEFEPTLTKVLPSRFESIVLELLIDENGRTVQVACIEGDCPAAADDGLEQLLVVPFSPAIRNGQPVASRKLIEILPTPTFGL